MWKWVRRYSEVVGVVTGPLVSLVSLGFLLIGVSQFGLPVLAWLGIGDAIFLVSGAAMIYAAHKERRAIQATLQAQEDRSKRLQLTRQLTGQTFYIWELLVPDDRPIVRDRIFTDCIVKGPAIVTLMLDTTFTHTQLGSIPVESLLYEAVDGPHQGLIALVNCQFIRGRLERIGYYANKETLETLRKIAVI
jgi:hypothetical protein